MACVNPELSVSSSPPFLPFDVLQVLLLLLPELDRKVLDLFRHRRLDVGSDLDLRLRQLLAGRSLPDLFESPLCVPELTGYVAGGCLDLAVAGRLVGVEDRADSLAVERLEPVHLGGDLADVVVHSVH